MNRFLTMLLMALPLLIVGRALSEPAPDFMAEAPPRRLALVVGNSAYLHTTQLPGSALDADKMTEILKGLDFAVTTVKDFLTRGDLTENYLRPFMSKIKEGDVVVFYFSGHGFAYGGENYITPLDFDLKVSSNDIVGTFISTTGIEIQATDRRPGLVLMILDACRNIPNFKVETGNRDDAAVSKGLAEPRARVASTVYWFSSALGATSIGSSTGGLSPYTDALAANIPTEGYDLERILREVRIAVMFKTGHGQVPWTSGSSSAQFFFKPTAQILGEERRLWNSVLEEGTQFAVTRFLEIYGTGPYGAAARDWLARNPNAPQMRPSAVSPTTAEIAWTTSSGQDIALPRIGGTLVAQATARAAPVGAASTPPAGAAGESARIVREETAMIAVARSGDPTLASARSLNRLGGAVTVDRVEARAFPTADAPVTRTLPQGTAVTIDGLAFDRASKTNWLHARTDKGDTSFFVEQKATGLAPIEVGTPRLEVTLQPRPDGVRSIVDDAPLVEALKRLQAAGTTVTWVSIATPRDAQPGADALNGLQAVFVKSVLSRQGISRDIITTSEGASDAGIRVRVFGKRGAQ
ncbi:caspase family protein [Methylobacterium oryzae]|uniref:Caspase family p20 domain-containing protein n=1 Tax=Methylobacterium oryzae TaxID=334852 RepID=A0ABU7TU33_9HYPH